ncbi:hypothetical protein FPV67DRAFT_1419452 [Lyophyllum atratum]|nr:hypothetical protein FPV67DRAFT_1419452 [Lyophyllum atratum]
MSLDRLLYSDSNNRVVSFEERKIDDDLWIGLNGVTELIPKEAAAYHGKALDPHGSNALIRPDGTFFDMEWADSPGWFHLEKHYHAWIPIADKKKLSTPWYYRLNHTGEIRDFHEGSATFEPSSQSTMVSDLYRFSEYFRGAADLARESGAVHIPTPFDPPRVHEIFDSRAIAVKTNVEAKRSILECLGFINWRRSCFPGRDKYWLAAELKEIEALDLRQYTKRGILVDLERDWYQIDFTVLLKNDVPIFYRWTDELANEPRFARFDPAILKAYHQGELNPSDTEGAYFDEERHNRVYEIRSKLEKYDEFLQFVEVDDEFTYGDPNDSGAKHFVIDFQGWHRREIRDKTMAEAFAARTLQEPDGDVIVYTRWLARRSQDEVLDYEGSDFTPDADEEPIQDPKNMHALREFYKDPYAPEVGEKIGKWSGLNEAPLENEESVSLLSRISTVITPTSMDVDSEEASKADSTPRGPSLRSSIPPRRDHAVPNPRRSQSPRPGPSTDRRFESDWASKMEHFIRDLIGWGAKMTHQEPSYRFPGNLLWNAFFLQRGYLLVERKETEVRMRYWAASVQGLRNVRQVLELAIEHHVRFRIGIKTRDLDTFRPYNDEMSTLEVATAKQPHMVGFQEETLTWGSGGAGFATNYIGKMGNVLRRGHAGALIPKGSPLAWIALHYGGDMILEKFIRGPSPGMVWHNLGESDSRDENPIHVLFDFVSPGEESLIYGHIPGLNGETDRWVYPTEELLEEFCDHWQGEWNPALEKIFLDVTKELKDDKPRARTRTEWREYLRRASRGTRKPPVILGKAFFEEGERRFHAAFGRSWHQQRVWNLEIPERYTPLTHGKQGGFVRRQ